MYLRIVFSRFDDGEGISIGARQVDDGERTVDSRSVELMTARELSIGAGRVDDGERTVDSRSVELMTAS